MALINRLSRLFKADFHAVLDQIEEPDVLLRHAIREMEDELAATAQHIRRAEHEQQALGNRRDGVAEKLGELEGELDLCFASGKDELARTLVRKKLEGQRLLKGLDAKRAAGARTLEEQRIRLGEDRASLDALRQKAELFAEREPGPSVSEFDDITWMARELTVSDDEIEVAFLREKAQRSAS